jgi:SNF2 family DNA or RNA helicase
MVAHAMEHPRCAIWAGMGMGKTSATLYVIASLLQLGLIRWTLILGPLRVARGVWTREAGQWSVFSHLRIAFVEDWTPQEQAFLRARTAYGRALAKDPDSEATRNLRKQMQALQPAAAAARLQVIRHLDILTINYDVLEQLVAILGDEWPFDLVVADEATRVKSFRIQKGGKRAGALGKVAFKRTKRWINLTGTPAPNGLQDLWGQTWFLDRGHRLGNTFSGFMDRWFGFRRIKDAVNPDSAYVERIVFPHSQAEIQGLLKDVCLTLDPKDWFDLQEPVVNTLYIDLPVGARKKYREMEKEFFTRLMREGIEHDIEAFGAAAKAMKCLQLCNGAAYVGDDNKTWADVHDEKLQALESVVEEAAGEPVLTAYHFKSDRARIMKRFPHAIDVATPKGLAQAQAGEGSLWIGHPASMGHGIDGLQQHCHTLAFFGLWFNLEEHMQFIERVGPVRQAQAGLERTVNIHYIAARDTVDEIVLERLTSKRSTQSVLMDAMNRYKERNHGTQG